MKRFAGFGLALLTCSIGGVAAPARADAPAPLLSPGPNVYSGYGAVAPSFSVLSARWTQPSVSCPSSLEGAIGGLSNTVQTGSSILKIPGMAAQPDGVIGTTFVPHVATWIGMVGMNGATDRTLIQTGTVTVCQDGVAHPMGFFETPSFDNQAGEPDVDANAPGTMWDTPATDPGDAIEATVTWDGSSSYRLIVANTTKGWKYGATFHSSVVPTGALTVLESIPYNVPGYSPVTFTDVTADGKPFGAYETHTFTIDGPNIVPGPLNDKSFTVPSP